MARTDEDIKSIVIDTEHPGVNGWAVIIYYKDNKRAALVIDYGAPAMLKETFRAIQMQMKSHQEVDNGGKHSNTDPSESS